MSKVLIDRALLERAVYSLELAYETDTPTIRDICSALSAPSGTPAMPVKAYYHEAPNEYGGFNKSVGLEVRKEFADAPLVLEADALTQIACLEGETAKRDARIVELESQYQRDVFGLNNECDPIGGDPAGGYANDNARLRSELAAIKAQEPVCYTTQGMLEIARENWNGVQRIGAHVKKDHRFDIPLYAAPVSEAKEQGVAMPAELDRAFITGESCDGVYRVVIKSETLKEMQAVHNWIARLNAAPIQQVSVPDGWRVERGYSPSGYVLHSPSGSMIRVCDSGGGGIETAFALFLKAMLAAAPAAPAADTRLVEALELAANRLDRLALEHDEFWRGYATMWVREARAALAAHSAKWVV